MSSTLVRVVDTNDSGNHISGTLRDNAWLQSIYDSLENAFAESTSFTPTWSNTGTANSLGNGTLVGNYFQFGKFVVFHIELVWGSTTSSGNGLWQFALPATAKDTTVIAGAIGGMAIDTGVNSYPLTFPPSATSTILPSTGSPTAGLTTTLPFTWGSGDKVQINGWYIAA